MAKRFCTLIVVPDAGARLRKLRLPVRGVWLLALAGPALLIIATVLGLMYIRMALKTSDFSALQAENADLRVKAKNLEVSAKKLDNQLNQVEALSRELTLLAQSNGMVKKPMESGLGGAMSDLSTDELLRTSPQEFDIGSLKSRVNHLQDQMNLLHDEFGFRINLARVTPDVWPLKGAVLSPFGLRTDPFGEGNEFHEGIDISGAYGAPVRATADGMVIFSARQSEYGNLIIIDHGSGITTRFGHLSRFQAWNGRSVKKGDIVGYVGMTGRTTGPHLHYEIRVNDRPVNPRGYLPREAD